jgi:hypothetical protein
VASRTPDVATPPDARAAEAGRLRLVSPQDGDRYAVPPGVEARYATVALRATGGDASRALRWSVDGRAVSGGRWPLRPGGHVVRAERGAERVEARIEVD